MLARIRNFGRNLEFRPAQICRPRNVADVLQLMADVRGREIRVGGRLHSWSRAVQTDAVYVDLRALHSIEVRQTPQGATALVGAGCQIKQLLRTLDRHGLTLPSLGLISEQSIAGATATGTHGSGKQCLSHWVKAVHLAHYDPETGQPRLSIIRDGDALRAAQCSLGCLGLVVALEMQVRPAYRIEERLTLHPTLDEVLQAESEWPLQQFFFLPWLDCFAAQQRRETAAPRSRWAWLYRAYWLSGIDVGLHLYLCAAVRWLGAASAVKFLYRRILPRLLWRGRGIVDRSQDTLIMEHELFRHIEIELFVRRSHLHQALERARALIVAADRGDWPATPGDVPDEYARTLTYTHHYPVCVRRVPPDDTLLSMSSGGDEVYFALSFISYARPDDRAGFYRFAQRLSRDLSDHCEARAHWGKYFPQDAATVRRLYPGLSRFRHVCQEFDAEGCFQNTWLRDLLQPVEGTSESAAANRP